MYNATVKISDGQSFVTVDFVIRIVAASAPPVFVYGGITPANNSTIQAYEGCPVSFTVRATDTDPISNTLTLQGVGIPQGAVFSPVTGSNTVTAPFSFTPTTEGTSVTSFIAEDNIGNQTIISVTLRILQPLLTANPSVVCVGSLANLVATPGTSASGVTNYTFRGPGGLIGSTSTATVNGLSAGVYSFSVTTSNSLNSTTACTSTAVTVSVPPTVTLSASGTLTCAVTSVTLTASSSTSATTTVSSNTVVPAAPTVSVTSQPSCTLATGTLTVTAPMGVGLTYSINGTTYINTTGSFTGVAAGTYAVTVRNSSGCTSPPTSVTVTAQLPTPVLTVNSASVCAGSSATLTIGGWTGGTLTWSTGDNATSIVARPVVTAAYSATCTNTTGCSATTSTTVTVRPTPTLTNTPTVTLALCAGTTATNSARIDLTTIQNAERADIIAGSSYANGPAFGAASNQLVTNGTVSFSNLPNPAAKQPYTIRLFNTAGTCFTNVRVTLDPVICQCPAPSRVRVAIVSRRR